MKYAVNFRPLPYGPSVRTVLSLPKGSTFLGVTASDAIYIHWLEHEGQDDHQLRRILVTAPTEIFESDHLLLIGMAVWENRSYAVFEEVS